MAVELSAGERVLWEGKPKPGAYAGGTRAFLFGGAVLFLMLVPFALAASVPIPADAPPMWPMFLSFLALLAMFSIGPVLIGVAEARHVRYVLTDRRALILSGKGQTQIDLASLGFMQIRPGSSGTSNIYFAPPWAESIPFNLPGVGGGGPPAFRAIAEGERVYRMLIEARDRLRNR